jgi:signal transduction histidine kinase
VFSSHISRWTHLRNGALFLYSVWLALFATAAHALDPSKKIPQYAHTAWMMQDGIFSSTDQAIVQTRDGSPWLGAESGLLRFNGVQFVPWSRPGSSKINERILTFHAARNGGLWIGKGRGLSYSKGGRIEDPNVGGRIDAIPVSAGGTISIARFRRPDHKDPLCEVRGRDIHCHSEGFEFVDYGATTLVTDKTDRLWDISNGSPIRWARDSAITFSSKALLQDHEEGEVGGAEMGFYLPAVLYQPSWFKALCIAMALVGVWAIYRAGLRQATAWARQRNSERLAERERIARELDTLLQSFHGIVLLFQMAGDLIGENEPARQVLNQALQQSDKAIVEGRERVMNLLTYSTEDLAHSFSVVGDELSKFTPCDYRMIAYGEASELAPFLRDEVYRIGREAITNAFRHANATEIATEISYKSNELRLIFRDNGDGIDKSLLAGGARHGRWGLIGMRERAKKIGAQLEIWSRPGSGTEIDLRIPAAVAFVAKQKNIRFR